MEALVLVIFAFTFYQIGKIFGHLEAEQKEVQDLLNKAREMEK